MSDTTALQSSSLAFLERAARKGTLTITTPDGKTHVLAGTEPGPTAAATIHDWHVTRAVLARGDIGLGEAYMQGWWDSPDIEAFLAWTIANLNGLGRMAWGSSVRRALEVFRDRWLRRNSIAGSRRNIMSHYDLGNAFYGLWLDPSMTYSSAIYAGCDVPLETAQSRKYGRILDEIGTREDILEIGCGWGGFIASAGRQNRRVDALTISERQHAYVQDRLPAGSNVHLRDYRLSEGRYPAIVSIEMLEAVGERYWPGYFRTVRNRLHADGVAVVQTITIRDDLFASYRGCSDYIRHFIFQGGMLASLERIRREAGAAGLTVKDVYSFGADYAATLREWLHRFDAATPQIAALGYDEPFRRGWRLYLAMSAAAFASGRTDVHQITFTPAR